MRVRLRNGANAADLVEVGTSSQDLMQTVKRGKLFNATKSVVPSMANGVNGPNGVNVTSNHHQGRGQEDVKIHFLRSMDRIVREKMSHLAFVKNCLFT